MNILENHDIFQHVGQDNALVVVTTNSYVKNNGSLVMGRGAARYAANMFKDLPFHAGAMIRRVGQDYGFKVVDANATHDMGLFQVKYGWWEDAKLELIRESARQLERFAQECPCWIYLNFPGIGNGRLKRAQVENILINEMPNNKISVCLLRSSK